MSPTEGAADEAPTVIDQAVELAQELTNARSNQLTPEIFAQRAAALAHEHKLGVRVTEAEQLRADGFGGITGIGQGSANPPRLVELWYAADGAEPKSQPPRGAIALAGKGVTFDSGGLSTKSAASMYGMHTDCAGAAAVLAALTAHAQLGGDTAVYAALPLIENIPGPQSLRPGDVVEMRDTTGVEIIDTDFEGRVILADSLALLAESSPRAIISLATLTHQIQVALGDEIAGLFGRDEELASQILTAAERADEALWRMPWATRYASQLRSTAPGARLRNHPLHDTGRAITAALFLGEFVPLDIPFAHIDSAGPAVRNTADGPIATGYGVRMLIELLRAWI